MNSPNREASPAGAALPKALPREPFVFPKFLEHGRRSSIISRGFWPAGSPSRPSPRSATPFARRPSRACSARLPRSRWRRGGRPVRSSYTQRLAERIQRRLVERFACRGVGVDRAGDVLEPRAHFERRADDRSETPAPTAWIPSTTWLPARTAAPWRGGVSPPKVRETRTLRGAQRPRSNSAKFSAERKTTPLAGCNLGRTRASIALSSPFGRREGMSSHSLARTLMDEKPA